MRRRKGARRRWGKVASPKRGFRRGRLQRCLRFTKKPLKVNDKRLARSVLSSRRNPLLDEGPCRRSAHRGIQESLANFVVSTNAHPFAQQQSPRVPPFKIPRCFSPSKKWVFLSVLTFPLCVETLPDLRLSAVSLNSAMETGAAPKKTRSQTRSRKEKPRGQSFWFSSLSRTVVVCGFCSQTEAACVEVDFALRRKGPKTRLWQTAQLRAPISRQRLRVTLRRSPRAASRGRVQRSRRQKAAAESVRGGRERRRKARRLLTNKPKTQVQNAWRHLAQRRASPRRLERILECLSLCLAEDDFADAEVDEAEEGAAAVTSAASAASLPPKKRMQNSLPVSAAPAAETNLRVSQGEKTVVSEDEGSGSALFSSARTRSPCAGGRGV